MSYNQYTPMCCVMLHGRGLRCLQLAALARVCYDPTCISIFHVPRNQQGGWYEGAWRRGEREGDGARVSRAGAVSAGLWRSGALAEPADLAAVAPAVAAAQQAARAARGHDPHPHAARTEHITASSCVKRLSQ